MDPDAIGSPRKRHPRRDTRVSRSIPFSTADLSSASFYLSPETKHIRSRRCRDRDRRCTVRWMPGRERASRDGGSHRDVASHATHAGHRSSLPDTGESTSISLLSPRADEERSVGLDRVIDPHPRQDVCSSGSDRLLVEKKEGPEFPLHRSVTYQRPAVLLQCRHHLRLRERCAEDDQ